MSVIVVATAFPVPEHRAQVIAAFEEAIALVHDEPGVELYAVHEGDDRLVMIEKYESDKPDRSTPRAPPSPACGRL
jgi:quinol monooxygenase YgiN